MDYGKAAESADRNTIVSMSAVAADHSVGHSKFMGLIGDKSTNVRICKGIVFFRIRFCGGRTGRYL